MDLHPRINPEFGPMVLIIPGLYLIWFLIELTFFFYVGKFNLTPKTIPKIIHDSEWVVKTIPNGRLIPLSLPKKRVFTQMSACCPELLSPTFSSDCGACQNFI
jgi:hypothetical protein